MSLIVGVTHFILEKNSPQSHLIIISLNVQINITHILRYSSNFPDSIYLGPPSSSPTPLSLRIRVLSSKNGKRRSTYSVSICKSVFFSYTKKTVSFQTYWSFWEGYSATWDSKISLWKCSSLRTPDLFNFFNQ